MDSFDGTSQLREAVNKAMRIICPNRRINTLRPLRSPPSRQPFLPIGCIQQNEGTAASLPNAPMPVKSAKADLRNSWKPAARKAGRFCDHRITKSGGPAREIIGFLVMCRLCPAFLAAGFLEFFRFVSALFTGIGAFGRLAAVPSFCAPQKNKTCLLHTAFWGINGIFREGQSYVVIVHRWTRRN